DATGIGAEMVPWPLSRATYPLASWSDPVVLTSTRITPVVATQDTANPRGVTSRFTTVTVWEAGPTGAQLPEMSESSTWWVPGSSRDTVAVVPPAMVARWFPFTSTR